ncbi:MAG TPA: GT4 family glycosyltransferase PelF [Acidimicrobiales bacterium]|nr:GT4 family glycosyltransferase PelF [Acidimicrobiales bacterium]
MRVALITEGTYPHNHGGVSVWCDQVIRGLSEHEFEVVAIVGSGSEKPEWPVPSNVSRLTPVPLWPPEPPPSIFETRRCPATYLVGQFLETLLQNGTAARFIGVLNDLFLAAQHGDLRAAFNSSEAVEVTLTHMRESSLESSRGTPDPAETQRPSMADAVQALTLIEHFLRPFELPPRRVDLCHAVSNGLAVLPAFAAKWQSGTPFLLTEHGLYLRERILAYHPGSLRPHVRSLLIRFFKRLVEAGYQMADYIAPVSRYCELWELRSGAERSRIRPIHNGIDPDRFPFAVDEPGDPTLVFVGRIDPLKDIETLLRSFALVRETEPAARLRMFGPREAGRYAARCDDLIESLGLAGWAVFEGRTDEPATAFLSGQVVLLSSISEGFPFAALEAMACGRPLVATDVGGVAEAVGPAGLIVPPRDPAALAEATLRLLGDAQLRRSVGQRARERVLAHFTLARCVAEYRDVYRDLVFSCPLWQEIVASIGASHAESRKVLAAQ